MSWTADFLQPVLKHEALEAIDKLGVKVESHTVEALAEIDQLIAAKDCAKLLLKSIPGPYVMVRMNGHANGKGWHKKESWSNDFIQVTITQITDKKPSTEGY